MSNAAEIKPMALPSDQNSSGRTLGQEELDLLKGVIESGTLTSTKGTAVKALESEFAELVGTQFAYACTSGTSALHTAIAAVDPEPGDEIITTSITDMGALTPIMYQSAVPVFADICPKTYNVTAETIAAKISDRTKAIMVTHLFGNPCEMEPIMALAREKGIVVIEDCAQAFMSEKNGEKIGAIGDIGCFSFQQGKHMTTGEGGVVVTNNEALARRMFLFINKAWGYGDANADHYFLAPNYRMNEITGAVALGQLRKLKTCVDNRVAMADLLSAKLAGMDGVETPTIHEGSVHTYWKYCLWVDQSVYPEGTVKLAGHLKEYGIASAPRYIVKPAFKCMVIRDQVTFGKSRWPFTEARPEALDYSDALYPNTFVGLASVLVLPWNELYTEEHVEYIAQCVHAAVAQLKEEYA